MKKTILFFSAVILSAIALDSCKKGADDPFISFRTRNGRLEGKWKLTKIAKTDVQTPSSTAVTTTTTFDGTIYTESISSGGSLSATGTYEMTIDKQGKVSWTSNYTQTAPVSGTAEVITGAGHWQWLSDNKRKDNLIIDASGSLFGGGLFYLDELKRKEMILKYNNSETKSGKLSSNDDTYTFTKE